MSKVESIEEIRYIFTRKSHSNIHTRQIINDFLDLVEKERKLLELYQSLDEVMTFNACDIDDIQERIKYINNRSKNRAIIQTQIKELKNELGEMK